MPGSLLSRYSPVPGTSVPLFCVTRYCSGESLRIASSFLLNFRICFLRIGGIGSSLFSITLARGLKIKDDDLDRMERGHSFTDVSGCDRDSASIATVQLKPRKSLSYNRRLGRVPP